MVLHPEDPAANTTQATGAAAGYATGRVVATFTHHAASPPVATCLTAADLAAHRGIAVTAADWSHGRLTLNLSRPPCAGVPLETSGARYVFGVDAKPAPGSSGHPNVALWPQANVQETRWTPVARRAGQQTVHVPPVIDQCAQTDFGIRTRGTVQKWPQTLTALGQSQPTELAYYVGNNHGCFQPPTIKVQARCAGDCTGTSTVTVTVTARSRYATTAVRLYNARTGTLIDTIRIKGSAHTSKPYTMHDGDRIRPEYLWGLVTWGAEHALGPVIEIKCPPAPTVTMTQNCSCSGSVTGTATDTNNTRYVHKMTITSPKPFTYLDTAGVRRTSTTASLDVQPGATGTISGLAWHKGQPLTVVVTSYLHGAAIGNPYHVGIWLIS